MSAQQRATTLAFRTLVRTSGVTVTYRRGAAESEVSAVPAATAVEVVNDEGTSTRTKIRDYLVRASDLAAAGFGEPQRGDRIEETAGGTTRTYEAVGPSSDSHWRWWDKGGEVYRIHTHLIDEAEA